MSRRSLIIAVAALGAPHMARAQEPDSTRLPRVVITATRVAEPTGSGIAAATVIDRSALQRSGVRDVADALRWVPGVAVARSGGPGSQTSLFLRGGENDYIRVLVDGVPVNEPGGAVDLAWLSVDDVERIELVRGPASVLYGTDAVSGVLQIFTRRAEHDGPAAELALESGRYETLGSRGTVSLGSARAGVLVGLSRDRTDGLLPFNHEYGRTVVTGALHAEPSSRTRAALTVRRVNDEFHYPTDGAGNVVDTNAMRRGRRVLASASVERALTQRVRTGLSFSSLDTRGIDDDRADSPADTTGLYHYDAVSSVRRRVGEGRLHIRLAPSVILTVGAELALETQRANDSSNFSVERSTFAADRKTRAVFGQWLAEHGRLSWTAGVRYDDNDVFGAFTTWRTGVALRAWTGATVRGTFATAFKAPTFLETFHTAFTVGNPDLVPERSRSWELGLRQSLWQSRVDVEATWFDQRFRDMIQYAFVSPEEPNYFNVAAAFARGMEVEIATRPASGVRAGAAATVLQTRVEDEGLQSGESATFVKGKRLLRRPSVVLVGSLGVGLPGRSTADVAVRYTGSRDDRDFATFPATPITLPSYTRVDLALAGPWSRAWSGSELQVQLRIENVLGSRYQEVANYPAAGRMLTLGARMRLD